MVTTSVPEAEFDAGWHSHPFSEVTLITDGACRVGDARGWQTMPANALFVRRRGEVHATARVAASSAHLWTVHFNGMDRLVAQLSQVLAERGTGQAWVLAPDQVETFRWLFLQMHHEQGSAREEGGVAVLAWLQLFLVNLNRWGAPAEAASAPIPRRATPQVLQLWQLVNAAVDNPAEELYAAPNYDSVRHAFRETFGCSPRVMLQRLRLERAQKLLRETSLSIKEVAMRVGYPNQNDFNRMFHRHTGRAPSHWRAAPPSVGRGATDPFNHAVADPVLTAV